MRDEGKEVCEYELQGLEGCPHHSLRVLRPQGPDHGDDERPALQQKKAVLRIQEAPKHIDPSDPFVFGPPG